MPEHLVRVTPQGIQVEPAMNERKASWIFKGDVMEKRTRRRGDVMSGRSTGSGRILFPITCWGTRRGRMGKACSGQAPRPRTYNSVVEQRPWRRAGVRIPARRQSRHERTRVHYISVQKSTGALYKFLAKKGQKKGLAPSSASASRSTAADTRPRCELSVLGCTWHH